MSNGNSTISLTYKFKGDAGGLRDMVADVERMQQAFRDGIQPAEQLHTSLTNFNQLSQCFDNIASSVQGLNDVVQDLVNAYAIQQQAEVKLETVMRQRMDATAEDIQQIKDLCSAQQEIGVIGDEVQLAGAQQIATFLTQKEALESLIPAMNNLAAQKKGLNVTEQDCVTIGNLFGKVMQGQTNALTRVGISFSDAQKKALENADEMERAALLAQIVTDNVGNMNEALAKTDAGKAKQVADAMGDLKENMGAVVAGIAPYTGVASQMVTLAANTGKAVTQVRALTTSVFGSSGALKFLSTQSVASALGMNAAGTAARFLAAGLRMIMAATAVTLVISAISAVVSAFTGKAKEAAQATDEMSAAMDRSKMAQQQAEETMRNVRAQIELDIAATKNFNGTKAEEQKLVQELNNRYGDTMQYFSSVADWYKALVANSEAYCDQMVIEAETRLIANKIAENKLKIANFKTQKADYDKTVNPNAGTTPGGMSIGAPKDENGKYSLNDVGSLEDATNRIVANRGIAIADGMITTLEDENEKYYQRLDELKEESKKLPVLGSPTPPNFNGGGGTTNTPPQREKDILEQIEEQIRANQKAALTANATELAELRTKTQELVAQRDRLKEIQDSLTKTPDYTPPQIDTIKTYDELEKALSHYNEKLRQAQPEERAEINTTIKKLEELREAWDIALNPRPEGPSELSQYIDNLVESSKAKFASMGSPLKGMSVDSLLSQYRQIENVLKGMDGDITAQQRESLRKAAGEYAAYAKKAAYSAQTVKSGWSNVKGVVSGIESMKSALEGNGTAWEKFSALVDGAIQVFEGIQGIIQLVQTLTAVNKMLTASQKEQTGEAVAGAAAQMAASTSNVSAAQSETNANLGAAASGFMKANSSIPIVGIVMAAAAIAAMIAMMASLPKFAAGGIAYGPTVGLFGEYAGASNNPEVVAPLDRLRSLIGETDGDGGRLVARVTGEQLEFVMERRKRRKNRM